MKSPITGKEMPIIMRETTVTFRKEDFMVIYPSYHCAESDEYFTTTDFDTLKMKQVYNQYRDKYNIPFPDEIKSIRKKYNLSAKKMSEILGLGVNSYRNYESGEVPNQSNANLIQMAGDPRQFRLLVKRSPVFSENESMENQLNAQGQKLLAQVDAIIDEERKTKKQRDMQEYLLGNELPDRYTGYTKPNLEKLKEMVVYFAERLKPTVTQLNKLLFYTDFYQYKNTANSISGVRYRAIDRGPVPNNYDSLFEFMESLGVIEIYTTEFDWGYKKEFFANEKFTSELFSDIELETLKKVCRLFQNKTTSELVELSHLEDAWLDNFKSGKKLIDYQYAFKLKV